MKINPSRILGEVVLWSAFLASGGHVYQVAHDMGNHPAIAFVHAVGLDGLVYVGINACRAGGRAGWTKGIISVLYGGGMSLAFNAASYSDGGRLPAWIIAMSMPVSLILSVIAGHGARATDPVDPVPVPAGVPPVTRVRVPRAVPVSQPAVSHVPADVPVARDVSLPDVPAGDPDVPAPVTRATGWDKELARKLLAEGELSRKEIAARVGTSRKSIDRLAAA